jgi:hypothetical protein
MTPAVSSITRAKEPVAYHCECEAVNIIGRVKRFKALYAVIAIPQRPLTSSQLRLLCLPGFLCWIILFRSSSENDSNLHFGPARPILLIVYGTAT